MRRLHATRGFTLVEVVVALTILVMITGTLFAIIQGSVRSATQIELIQRENDSINRFLDLCRRTFTTLPSTATLTLSSLGQTQSDYQELTITGAPTSFGFGINPISYKDTILGLRPDPSGETDQNGAPIHYVSLSREDLIPETSERTMSIRKETSGLAASDEQGRLWMPLLPGVVQMKWRFYKEADDTWLEEWEESAWPELIEIQLVMKDRVTPIRMVYSLPVIKLVAGTGTSTSTNTGSGATGNANQQGQGQQQQGAGNGGQGGNQGQGGGRGGRGGGGRGGQNGNNNGNNGPGAGGGQGGGGRQGGSGNNRPDPSGGGGGRQGLSPQGGNTSSGGGR